MTSPSPNLTSSGITIPSDSENYDANNELSSTSSSTNTTTSSPLILYKPPTLWGLLRGAAINLLLPFVNGLMLGFGELVANEAAYRLGWSGTKIFPTHRSGSDSRRVGPGVEMRADPVERRRRNGQEMDMYTSME
ncbi:TOM13 domain containing protein [Pyrenophora tritici-repentis]|uniref:Outer membrane protein TOM13 n=1 Tax=Pyrenophora tritici-repentis TaxID=45151 RepID=A0A2W1EEW6_9PLEO|nr:TOM13 domain-containing protein [Pyrenophora tritici-repentis]KAF7442815.1 TOM13 domain containing protein [Pyrenophora tritici-repentis]KAF7568729.1 TOM13 domain containing protein [Pyrenophora tritici-repentis]KAG9376331.1 TOM13 domain containing protein [Pyrenophora tritici-repentis]KAI0575303.1 TOM13 domain-containing protein [Pyrenophora tritici-repentis]